MIGARDLGALYVHWHDTTAVKINHARTWSLTMVSAAPGTREYGGVVFTLLWQWHLVDGA